MTHPDTGELIATLEKRLAYNGYIILLAGPEAEALIAALRSGHEAEETLAEADAAINWLREYPYQPNAQVLMWCEEAAGRHTARQQEGGR